MVYHLKKILKINYEPSNQANYNNKYVIIVSLRVDFCTDCVELLFVWYT
jgi:hypothetical protein